MNESADDDDEDDRPSANPFDPPAPVKHPGQAITGNVTVKPQTRMPPKKDPMMGAINPANEPGEQAPILAKPSYRGTFVGQVFRSAGQIGSKRSAWQNKAGEWRGKNVEGPTTTELVWDGKDWVTSGTFADKYRKRTSKTESAWASLGRKFLI